MITIGALATVMILSAVCGGPRSPMDVGSAATFRDEGTTETSGYEGLEPKIEMEKREGLWFITVYQGRQPSRGYGIRVERGIHVGTGLRLRARFTTPAAGTVLPTVSTSPAHTISMPFGADGVTLYDQDDQERAELLRTWNDPSRAPAPSARSPRAGSRSADP